MNQSLSKVILLQSLIRHSPHLKDLPVDENTVARALRTTGPEVFDVRYKVDTGGPSHGKTKDRDGLYEIRRKNFDLSALDNTGRQHWEDRAIFIVGSARLLYTVGYWLHIQESLPPQIRTPAAIVQFIQSLGSFQLKDIQAIDIPPKTRRCAFVIFSTTESASSLIEAWPWDRSTSSGSSEAQKYGVRAISKARYLELEQEYLAYQQRLAQHNAAASSSAPQPPPARISQPNQPQNKRPREQDTTQEPPVQSGITKDYPIDCLLFVRNVHPETNKTTLRSLFAKRLGGNPDGVDYVDFNKGVDTVSSLSSTHS
jgi:hypothetical protein